MHPHLFQDRHDAGRELALHLSARADQPDVRILALPRGGEQAASEVTSVLNAWMDVFMVRKLGVRDVRRACVLLSMRAVPTS